MWSGGRIVYAAANATVMSDLYFRFLWSPLPPLNEFVPPRISRLDFALRQGAMVVVLGAVVAAVVNRRGDAKAAAAILVAYVLVMVWDFNYRNPFFGPGADDWTVAFAVAPYVCGAIGILLVTAVARWCQNRLGRR